MLKEIDVLRAIQSAVSPMSAYIYAEIDKLFSGGERGYGPSKAVMRARLRSLLRQGFIERVTHGGGYYGHKWRITVEGKEVMQRNPAKYERIVTIAFYAPSGTGKSTVMDCFSRLLTAKGIPHTPGREHDHTMKVGPLTHDHLQTIRTTGL